MYPKCNGISFIFFKKMSYLDKAWKVLRKNWLKKTKARTSIINILAKTTTAVSYIDIVKLSKDKKLDEVTVYRFLQELEKLHLAKKILSLRGYMRCDWSHHTHNHYFLVCSNCQKVTEKIINEDEKLVSSLGIYPDNQCIEIVWKCDECRASIK